MKRLSEYQAIILDVDGTLYYQHPVRRAMLKEMLLRPWRVGDYRIVQMYRKLYDQGLCEVERYAVLPERAPSVIQEWMIDRPLKHIAKYRDAQLIELMERVSAAGVQVIVYSDYPVNEKLAALRYSPSQSYCADDLGTMKPNATGLMQVLINQGIEPNACCVIGDRYDKDGSLAHNMGADCVILSHAKGKRKGYYKTTFGN